MVGGLYDFDLFVAVCGELGHSYYFFALCFFVVFNEKVVSAAEGGIGVLEVG